MAGPIAVGQLADGDAFGTGSVNKLTVSDIDTHVGNAFPVCILEKYKVTGL